MLTDAFWNNSLFSNIHKAYPFPVMIYVLNSCFMRIKQKKVSPFLESYNSIVILVNMLHKMSKFLIIHFNPYKTETARAYKMDKLKTCLLFKAILQQQPYVFIKCSVYHQGAKIGPMCLTRIRS